MLIFVACTGSSASDLTAQLFYEFWVLLLHLLSKLLPSEKEKRKSS